MSSDDLQGRIGAVTGLQAKALSRLLIAASPRQLVRSVLSEHWPATAERLGDISATTAAKLDLAEEISAVSGIPPADVRSLLADVHGNTRVCVALGDSWEQEAECDDEEADEEDEPLGEAELKLAGALAEGFTKADLRQMMSALSGEADDWSNARLAELAEGIVRYTDASVRSVMTAEQLRHLSGNCGLATDGGKVAMFQRLLVWAAEAAPPTTLPPMPGTPINRPAAVPPMPGPPANRPTPADRQDYLTALAALPRGRAPWRVQTAADYGTREAQIGYAKSYGVEYAALWWRIRSLLDPRDAVLWSVGAGPFIDLVGWCWERPWQGTLFGIDPLPWEAVRGDPAWARAVARICGKIHEVAAFVPGPSVPVQLESVADLHSIPSSQAPAGGVVLMPYVLNHLRTGNPNARNDVGAHASELRKWLIEAVDTRGSTVILADYNGPGMWRQLDIPVEYHRFGMGAADYAAFGLDGQGLVGRERDLAVLVGDRTGWRYLENR